jgi:hypothetical protein
MLMTSLTDPELKKGFMKLGIDPLNALRRGRPEEIISIIGKISDNLRAGTLLSGKLAEKYTEKFGIASDVMFQLSGKTGRATKDVADFYKMSTKAGQSAGEMSEELTKQRTWWGNVQMGIKNYVSQSHFLGAVKDNIEGIGPALQASWAGFMLLKQAGSGASKTFKFFANEKNFVSIKKNITGMISSIGKMNVVQKTGAFVTGLFSGAMKLLNAAFITSPIGWIVLGVGALVTAFVIAYKKSETFRNMINSLWEGIKNVAGVIWDFLLPAFKAVGKAIFTWIITPYKLLFEGVKFLWEFLQKTPVSGFFDWIKNGIEVIMKPLGWVWERIQGIWNMFFKSGQKGTVAMATTSTAGTTPTQKGVTGKPAAVIKTEAGKEMNVTVDQSEVVKVLEKVVMLLTDIRDSKPNQGVRGRNYRGEFTPDQLALRGTI